MIKKSTSGEKCGERRQELLVQKLLLVRMCERDLSKQTSGKRYDVNLEEILLWLVACCVGLQQLVTNQ